MLAPHLAATIETANAVVGIEAGIMSDGVPTTLCCVVGTLTHFTQPCIPTTALRWASKYQQRLRGIPAAAKSDTSGGEGIT